MNAQMEAETLYSLLQEGRMGFKSFLQNAEILEAHHPEAAEYLLLLLRYGRDSCVGAGS